MKFHRFPVEFISLPSEIPERMILAQEDRGIEAILGTKAALFSLDERGELLPLIQAKLERFQTLLTTGATGLRKSTFERLGYRDIDFVSLQCGTALLLSQLPDNTAIEAFLEYLREGPPLYREIAIRHLGADDYPSLQPIPDVILQELRTCIKMGDREAELVSAAAQRLDREDLIPDLVAAWKQAAEESRLGIARELIRLTDDPRLLAELLEDVVSRVATSQEALEWINLFTGMIRWNFKKLNTAPLTVALGRLIDLLWEVRADEAITSLIENQSEIVVSALDSRHIPLLERLADSVVRESLRKTITVLLAELRLPDRVSRLALKRPRFEDLAFRLKGTVLPEEIDSILAMAEKPPSAPGATLGKFAVRLLWDECGERGRAFLKSHPLAIDFDGCRVLIWILEEITPQSAARSLRSLGLTDLSEEELLARYAALGPSDRIERNPATNCPSAAFELLNIAGRRAAFDIEDAEVPPNYGLLLKWLCGASAGQLHAGDCRILTPKARYDSAKNYRLVMECNGAEAEIKVANLGDYFDVSSVVNQLHALLEKQGSADRYHVSLDGSYLFGPPDKISKYVDEMAVALLDEVGSYESPSYEAVFVRARAKLAEVRSV